MTGDHATGALFLKQARAFLNTEYRTKLRAAVEAMPEDALWARPNESSNSVANLLLHLSGNVRQWLVSGVGGAADVRQRNAEFAARDQTSRESLLAGLEQTLAEADAVLAALTPESLTELRNIQGRDTTVLSAIFEVVQHFSQHLGQIIWAAKQHAPGKVRFYDDGDGLAKPVWKDLVRKQTEQH